MDKAKRHRLPAKRGGRRITVLVGDPPKLFCEMSTGEYKDGRLGEIFLDHPREGSFIRDMINAFAMSVSLGLQHGVPLEAYAHTFRDFKMEPDFIRTIFSDLESLYPPKETHDPS